MYSEYSTLRTAVPVPVSGETHATLLPLITCWTTVGSLIGGQVYARANNGWTVLMGLSAGMGILAAVAAAFGAGDRPLATRLSRRRRQSAPPAGDDATQQQPQWDSLGSLKSDAIHMEKVHQGNFSG
jgi:hypothetical protein